MLTSIEDLHHLKLLAAKAVTRDPFFARNSISGG